MKTSHAGITALALLICSSAAVPAGPRDDSRVVAAAPSGQRYSNPLDSLGGIEVRAFNEPGLDPARVMADTGVYRARRALHLMNDDSAIAKGNASGGEALAILTQSNLRDGQIDLDVVAWPRDGAPPDNRGFAGVAFHVQKDPSRFEAFYLRFTNGRSENQLRRNHAAQYVSEPDFPWFRLRAENPGEYESYVDIEQKAWTHVRVLVKGSSARLYVNEATEPCLIVNDLKLGAVGGQVALWNGGDTEAYFSNLQIEAVGE